MTDSITPEKREVRPLDLSMILKHAFMSGRESVPEEPDNVAAWVNYAPPEDSAPFKRIISALSAIESHTGGVKPLGEDDYEEIISAAAINMKKAASGMRGQAMTAQDSIDWWVMKETERRILSALSSGMTEAMLEALKRIRDTAMEHTLTARIPECGVFGGIAQDADWLLSEITTVTRQHECRQWETTACDESTSVIQSQAARIAELKAGLDEAIEALDWASRRMKGNCARDDVSAVVLSASRARAILNKENQDD